jgi:hypothetical protein
MRSRNRTDRIVDETHQTRVLGNGRDRGLWVLQHPWLIREPVLEAAASLLHERGAGLFQRALPSGSMMVPGAFVPRPASFSSV